MSRCTSLEVRRRVGSACISLLLVLFCFVPATAQAAPAASISGRVVAAADGEPIAGARVFLAGTDREAITTADGRFRLQGLPPGLQSVQVSYLGSKSDPERIALEDGEVSLVQISLDIRLDPLRAVVKRTAPGGKLRGFYERMEREQGYFITREDILTRDPSRVTDLLRRIPGMHVGRDGIAPRRVGFSRPEGGCPIQYYLDGARAPGLQLDDLSPRDLEGIEIYPGLARVPMRFRYQARCGVIVVWTREPSQG
ncbi:MAG: carboxypeptidase regulatory-like domain-containing protein [Gemmatimonadota bacterium]